jgi:hypothetical protein
MVIDDETSKKYNLLHLKCLFLYCIYYLSFIMENRNNLNRLGKRLFWDINPGKLDLYKNKNLIIERVVTRGDIEDFKLLTEIYGKDEVKNQVQNCAYLDRKSLNWLSIVFNIPKTNFKCYSKMQSKQVHWNF